MKRIFLLLILSIFVINCANNNLEIEREFTTKDGKKILVTIEEKEVRKNEKILVAEYQIDERILKEETVETHTLEIWKDMESLADEKELNDGIIKSKYLIGKDEKSNKPVYEEFLFEAEKIENGTWKIRKVN